MKKASTPGLTSSTDPGQEDLVLIGRLGRPHGLRGHLLLIPESDYPDRFRPGSGLILDSGERVTVSDFRPSGPGFIIAFAGLEDRTAAERLRGLQVFIPADQRRALEPDEYWPDELVGLSVRDQAGTVRGRVAAVDDEAPQARLVVTTPNGDRLVPLVAALVTEISISHGYLVIEDVPGLLDDDAPGSGELHRN